MGADERFYPGTSRITEIESFHRYHAAASLCADYSVLDAASGEGYGSNILAGKAACVTGLDLCEEAVKNANKKYGSEKLSYVHGSALEMPFADKSFDRVVSFETIEHLPDHRKFLSEIRRVLKDDGILILSSPNKTPFRQRNQGENEYHITELEADELQILLKDFFPEIFICQQDAFYNSVISANGVPFFYVQDQNKKVLEHPGLRMAQYSIVLASAHKLPELASSCFLDAAWDDETGYTIDDEAVVNQFGLRGEFEKKYAECENQRRELAEKDQVLEQQIAKSEYLYERCNGLDEKLISESAKSEYLYNKCGDLEKSVKSLNAKSEYLYELKNSLEKQLSAENAKAEYLFNERAALETKLETARQSGIELVEKNSRLDEKIQELKRKQEELISACSELEELIKMKNSEYQDLSSRYAALNDDYNSECDKNKQLIEEYTVLENKFAEENTRYQQLAEKYAELELKYRQECEKSQSLIVDFCTLDSRFKEEQAKSEYLWYKYNEIKDSLAFRLFGRWALRRKIKNFFCGIARGFHWFGKKLVQCLPISYRRKTAFKDFIYSRFGKLLGNVSGYRNWLLRRTLGAMQMIESDSGLIVPKDIPLTSIIIPVYNNIEYTRRCIYSIYHNRGVSPFEIVVVDDCSPKDNYKSLLKDFPEIKLVRNEKNSGFLLTANKGAENASGEYIIFLNNDTEVLPGWLDELTTALYNHPEAGMIGSQLIHLGTGLLQESGNLICKNGDMMPLGRGVDPQHPNFTYFREVDFCSAASIILRKKVFDEMHGFDTIFVPAYFEDPDLGLRMQKAGYKNYVCPLSKVLHQEMASYGDTLNDKCEKNRQTFLNRWSEYLQQHSLYESREEGNNSFKWDKERIIYIDAEVPMADRGSGGMDAIFFMEYMIKRGYHVCFHGEYTPGYVPKYTTILLRMGVECIYLPHRKIWEYLADNGWTFSHIFVSRIYQARCFDRLLKKHCPQATYIFDTVDVHFVREKLEADLRNDPELQKLAEETKKYELAVSEAADATIVISSDEKKLLENDYNLTNVVHIPQARQLFGLAPNQNRRGAVFIGSAHPPNMDGLRYFHDEILPLLPKDFKLTIIGEALRDMIGKTPEYQNLLKCPHFNFVGFVADLGDVLNFAKMTVAPLRYGAGTKGKVASSMAYGIPCVSSAFGTEGTGMMHGENIMIAKSAEEFAEYIKTLDSDTELWKRISDGGIKFIRDNYAPEAVEKMMDDLFAVVKARKLNGRSNWASTPVVPKVDEPAS